MKRFSAICGRKKGSKASSSSTPPIITSKRFFSEDPNEQPPPQPAPSPPQPEDEEISKDEDKSEDQQPDYFFPSNFEDHVFEPLPYNIYYGGGYMRPKSPMEKNAEGPGDVDATGIKLGLYGDGYSGSCSGGYGYSPCRGCSGCSGCTRCGCKGCPGCPGFGCGGGGYPPPK